MTSTESNANLVGRKSVLVQAVDQDVFVMGKTSISLICGKSSIVLLEDGTIRISGVKGLVRLHGGSGPAGREDLSELRGAGGRGAA